MTLKTNELQLGDVVRQDRDTDGPFETCVVTQITDIGVELFRPYGITADFSHIGGVIPYTGVEMYTVEFARNIEWVLFTRKVLK